MRIVHLTSAHPTFDRRIFHKEALSLAAAGHEVHLIVPSADRIPESANGVHLHAVPRATGRWSRLFGTCFRVTVKAFRTPADIYHFHDPELIPWCLLLRLFGKRVVMDMHEDYAAQVQGMRWLPNYLRPLVSAIVTMVESIGARVFNGVAAADSRLVEKVARLAPGALVVPVHNFPTISRELRDQRLQRSKYEARRILFLGGVSRSRCIEEFVAALEQLSDLQFEAFVAGHGTEQALLSALKATAGWKRVTHLGFVPLEQVDSLMISCSISINLYSRHPNNFGLGSNRLFEALAAGLPVIVSEFPMPRAFVEEHRCGLAVDPGDPAAIAAALRTLLTDPDAAMRLGQNGRDAVFARFDWASQARNIEHLYSQVIQSATPS